MLYKAVIFDLDGVICFTDEYHFLAWKEIADSLDIPFDKNTNNLLRGVSRMESLEIILRNHNDNLSKSEKEKLAKKKNELYKKYLSRLSPDDLSEEVKSTLDELRNRGLKLAIGSSSKNAPLILERLGLSGYFDAVSDGNNISKSKPDPEVFQKAAQMLDIAPKDCLVVEDAVSGAQAADNANMYVACLGDASQNQAGDYNMNSIRELLVICR